MKRAAAEFLTLVFLFFATWFVLSKINWMDVLRVEQATRTTEEKLGEIYWKLFRTTETELKSPIITKSVDSLVTRICKQNGINRAKVKLHILKKAEVNAFTLPDDYLVVYSGLIAAAENEAELMGILSHELAHMEKNHVMKKLLKEVGLSVLISMTTGNGSGEIIKGSAKLISSSAFDRDLEREADLTAVDYLLKAQVNPEPFANFLYRLGEEGANLPDQVYWVSTHPDSKARAEAIISYLKGKPIRFKPVLSPNTWKLLQAQIKK